MADACFCKADVGPVIVIKNALGSTGIFVSQLGLGTVKFGRNQGVKYPEQFTLPADQEIRSLLSFAKELGINLLDTAPAYGTSEERLGKLLTNRHDWIICGKAGEEFINGESHFDFSAEAIAQSVERSLRRLHTDYLDIVLIHSDGNDLENIEKFAVFDTLKRLKEKGLIRAFGMSTKTVEGGLLAVEHSDVVMVTYNVLQTEERPVIVSAHEKQKGVLIKKALASGHLQKISDEDPVKKSMDFIFGEQGVSSVIVGTLNQKHLEQNVRCV